jgi:hypothetical protein
MVIRPGALHREQGNGNGGSEPADPTEDESSKSEPQNRPRPRFRSLPGSIADGKANSPAENPSSLRQSSMRIGQLLFRSSINDLVGF